MREHMGLYRGKRIDNGEWMESSSFVRLGDGEENAVWKYYLGAGNPAVSVFDNGNITASVTMADALFYEVDPDTVGECTGLTDKNGKLIFEGDILEHHAQSNIVVNRGVVNWDAKNARWAHQLNTMNPCFYMHNPNAVEIIGNIHDNPELLKGGEADG